MNITSNAKSVLALLGRFPEVLQKEFDESRNLGGSLRAQQWKSITIAADGQTLLAAKLFETLGAQRLTVPVIITDDLVFPRHTYRPGSLVVATSSDKITPDIEEEIGALLEKGATVVCVAPESKITRLAALHTYVHTDPANLCKALPEYLFFLLTGVASSMGVLGFEQVELEETIQLLRVLRDHYHTGIPLVLNEAKDMASVFSRKVLFIFGTSATTAQLAQIWAVRIRHFSGQLADWGNLAEESGDTPLLENAPCEVARGVVLLRNRPEPSYVEERVQTLKQKYESNAIEVKEVFAQGSSTLARASSILYLGSFLSVYLAIVAEFTTG